MVGKTVMIKTLGAGPPLVVIPGLDGHCTWLQPMLDEMVEVYSIDPTAEW